MDEITNKLCSDLNISETEIIPLIEKHDEEKVRSVMFKLNKMKINGDEITNPINIISNIIENNNKLTNESKCIHKINSNKLSKSKITRDKKSKEKKKIEIRSLNQVIDRINIIEEKILSNEKHCSDNTVSNIEIADDISVLNKNIGKVDNKLNYMVYDSQIIKETLKVNKDTADSKYFKTFTLIIKILLILCILFFITGGTLGWFVNSVVVYKFFTYFAVTSICFFIIGIITGNCIKPLFKKRVKL